MNNNVNGKVLPPDLQQEVYSLKSFDITRRDIVFSVVLLIISLGMSFLGIWGGFKSGFYVSLILFVIAATAYLLPKRSKIKLFPLCCMVLGVFVSLSLVLTTNISVKLLSMLSFVILNLTWFLSLVSDKKETGDLSILRNIFLPFFKGITLNLSPTVLSLASVGEKKRFIKILIGLACAVPVIFIVVPLLMSSDEAFSGMMKMLFGNIFMTVAKILWGIVISMLLISYCFTLGKDKLPLQRQSSFKGIENIILISFLSTVSVCYLAYLFSQFAYFFSAFSGFLPQNYEFTVADYARRGFFEMGIIAGINFVLIFTSILLSRKNNGKSCIPVRILCCFIALFTLIIIATAISKMVLYISCFGMTRLRIQTTAFMIFLCVVFIALIIRLFLPKIRVLRVAFLTSAAVLIILGCFNINSIVAKYNYNAYKEGNLKEMDVYTIYELGYEGIPYLVKLADDKNTDVANSANRYLYEFLDSKEYITVAQNGDNYKISYSLNKSNNPGSYSLPESIALNELKDYIKNNSDIIYEQYKTNESLYSGIDYFF